jgi:hypothetical protein
VIQDRVTREPVTRAAVDHIIANLREHDAREIYAQRWDDNPVTLADYVMVLACNDLWRVFLADGEPAAMIGATLIRPGVCVLCGCGTNRWGRVIRPLTRYVLDVMMPAVLRAGVHRAECQVMASNTQNLRWILSLGGEIEGTLRGYGRGGEDFLALGWRRDNVHESWRRHAAASGDRARDTGAILEPGCDHGGPGPDDGAAGRVRPATGSAETTVRPATGVQSAAGHGPEGPAGRAPGPG